MLLFICSDLKPAPPLPPNCPGYYQGQQRPNQQPHKVTAAEILQIPKIVPAHQHQRIARCDPHLFPSPNASKPYRIQFPQPRSPRSRPKRGDATGPHVQIDSTQASRCSIDNLRLMAPTIGITGLRIVPTIGMTGFRMAPKKGMGGFWELCSGNWSRSTTLSSDLFT